MEWWTKPGVYCTVREIEQKGRRRLNKALGKKRYLPYMAYDLQWSCWMKGWKEEKAQSFNFIF